jgi:hypothetical protein
VHEHDRPATPGGRDKPAGHLETVAARREADLLELDTKLAR